MKRAATNSRQPQPVDKDAKIKLRYRSLLQDYLELQKEFVSKKKKLQAASQKRETLSSEVLFLKERHSYLIKMQSLISEMDMDMDEHQSFNLHPKPSSKAEHYNQNGRNNPSRVLDMKPPNWGVELDARGKGKEIVMDPVKRLNKKPKVCLVNEKSTGKKKFSVQDQVVLKV